MRHYLASPPSLSDYFETDSSSLTWGEVHRDIPDQGIQSGDALFISTSATPALGDLILCSDENGRPCIRIYQPPLSKMRDLFVGVVVGILRKIERATASQN